MAKILCRTHTLPHRLDASFHKSCIRPCTAIHLCGPVLSHFRDNSIQDVWDLSRTAWKSILDSKTTLPTLYIWLFKDDPYIGRCYFPSGDDDCTTNDISSTVHVWHDDTSHTCMSVSQCITPKTTQHVSQTTPYMSTRLSTHIHPLNLLSRLNSSGSNTEPEEDSTDKVSMENDLVHETPVEME